MIGVLVDTFQDTEHSVVDLFITDKAVDARINNAVTINWPISKLYN
jgi:hypothetical protein